MKPSIFALALGTFSLGIAEFSIMGILSVLSSDLGVSVTRGGHIISAYAFGVCAGACMLPLFFRWNLKRLLTLLAAIIAIGNLATALAPGYITLLAARFVSGLPHGAFFGVGAIVARKLAKPGEDVLDVSLMIAGMSVATLVGVPFSTLLAENVSWRIVFLTVALSGLLSCLSVRLWIPDIGALPNRGSFRSQFAFLRRSAPWLIFGGVILAQIGLYCWYSYIDPLLTDVSGFSTSSLTWLMAVAGLGMFVGNLASGKMSLHMRPSSVSALIMAIGVVVLIMACFFSEIKWAMVIILFFGTFALFGSGSPLQSDIVGYSRGGEMLGGTCIQIAYNLGNALAAWIGGIVINATHSYLAPAAAGIPIVMGGTALILLLYWRHERHSGASPNQ